MHARLGGERGRRIRLVATVAFFVGLVVAAAIFLPDIFRRLVRGDLGWLSVAAALEAGSCAGFVLLFEATFGRAQGLDRVLQVEVASAEVGANTLLPSAGAGGLALGVWALRRAGVPGRAISERSIAFLILQNTAFLVGVVVVGFVLLATSHAPTEVVLWPAVGSLALVIAILAAAWWGRRTREPGSDPGRLRRWAHPPAVGAHRALALLQRPTTLVGATAYAALDFAAMWATFRAFGLHPPLARLLLGYLVGQGGTAVPVPGGIGPVEAGTIGALVALGLGAQDAAVGVLAYRAIFLVVTALWGLVGYLALRHHLAQEGDRPCGAIPASAHPPHSSSTAARPPEE